MKKSILLLGCILTAAFIPRLFAQNGVDSMMMKRMLDAYSGDRILIMRLDYYYSDCENQGQTESGEKGYYYRTADFTYTGLPGMESYVTDKATVGIDHTQKIILVDSSGRIKEPEHPLKALLATLRRMEPKASIDTLEDSYLIRYEYESGYARWTEWRVERESFRVLESSGRLRGRVEGDPDRCFRIVISESGDIAAEIRKKIELLDTVIEWSLKEGTLPGEYASYRLHIL